MAVKEPLKIQPEYLFFLCGCKYPWTEENKEITRCPAHAKEYGFRLYITTYSINETIEKAYERWKSSQGDVPRDPKLFIERFFRQVFNSSDYLDVTPDDSCVKCGHYGYSQYEDCSSGQYICDKCRDKLILEFI